MTGAVGVTIATVGQPERRRRAVVVAAGISAACWMLFVALAVIVTTNDPISIDQSLLAWVDAHRTPALTSVMRGVTWLGSAAVLYPATFIVAVYWWRRDRRWEAAATLAASLLGSTVFYNVFKQITERPRPPAQTALATYTNWSFPSGHATQSAAFFAMLIVLISFRKRAQPWQPAIATAVVIAVGASRIYLGAHWLTDVLGGYALGGAWASLVAAIALTVNWIGPAQAHRVVGDRRAAGGSCGSGESVSIDSGFSRHARSVRKVLRTLPPQLLPGRAPSGWQLRSGNAETRHAGGFRRGALVRT